MKGSGSLAPALTLTIAGWLLGAFAYADTAPTGASNPTGPSKKKPDLPLELERRLEFETDEATWTSLDVTPDGQSIVFDMLGDLYQIPVGGGEATRLTEGPGFDCQPRVSPDGQWIAFISDRDGADNLWIAKADGSEPRKLSKETQATVVSPSWTPDSQYVIVTHSSRNTQLRLYHVDGGTGVTLDAAAKGSGGPPSAASRGPSRIGAMMSPDGRFLYFAQSAAGPFARFSPFPSWQIARRDMHSGDVDTLTQAEGSAVRPVLSPDGRFLVYATRHEAQTGLRVRDLESGADRWLAYPVQRDEMEGRGVPTGDLFPGYAFTPDGRYVLVTSGGKIHRVEVENGERSVVPFKAQVALDVGPDLEFPYRVDQGPVRARLIQDPHLSADGQQLAFSVLTKIYLSAADGAEPKRLTQGEAWEFKPTWSPDGQWIAYVTWSMADGGHIWKMRADSSGNPIRLTKHPAFYTDIVFSPDGQRLVGLRGNEFMRHQTFSEFGGLRIPLDLIWLSATSPEGDASEGGAVHLVTPGRGIGAPHFVKDNDRIYVYSNKGLLSLRYDGTDRRIHLKVTGPKNPRSPELPAAETVLMRPDGKWALARVTGQLFVVAAPAVGGQAPSVNIRGPAVPVSRLTDIGADFFGWADGGDSITWAIGSTFYKRSFDSLEFRTPEKDEDEDKKGKAEKGEGKKDEEAPKDPLDLHESVEAVEIVLEFPRASPKGVLVLRHATVISMAVQGTGQQDVMEDADVVVTNHRITAVGKSGEVEIPRGAREIDASGKFIVPGFVDTHAHWELRTHDVLEPQNWSLVANLAYGVTSGLDVQTSTHDYFAYQDLVETGQSLGQRAFMTGPGVFSSNDFQSYEATLSYLKRYKHHYRTSNLKSYMVGNRKQRQWVVKASKELGLNTTTEGGSELKLDLTHAIDGFHGNEHNMPVTPLYKDVVELYARTQTAYTPTLLVLYGGPDAKDYFFTGTEVHDDAKLNRFTPHNRLDEMARRRRIWVRQDEHNFDEVAAQAAKIQRAGGLVGVGGHGEVQGLGYHWEMWALALGGMTPREVLQAATIDGAKIIGIEQDIGSIEVGKLADLVVLDKNPLDDIRHTAAVRYVVKNGELFEGDTMKQLWPVERELAAFWWWDAQPKAWP